MSKYDPEVIEKYRNLLKKDPRSQVFAPLAEAYRESGQILLAEKVALQGIKLNPQYSGGHLVLAKILKDQQKVEESLVSVKLAIENSPENLLAHQLEGDLLLELKRPIEALRSYKMVLLLNPQSTKAKKIVQKLESLTAADYDEDVFSMTRLKAVSLLSSSPPQSKSDSSPKETDNTLTLQRGLSLIDAFLVRNDLVMAQSLMQKIKTEIGEHAELNQREKILRSRTQSSLLSPLQADQPEPLTPILSREKLVVQKKLHLLKSMLRVIELRRSQI